MKMRGKKLGSLILALVTAFSLALPAEAAEAAESATGTTLRLSDTKGTVTVKNAAGKDVKTRSDMRLYNDYTVKTGKGGSAYIELDDAKALQLDANSAVKIKKSGKQLEVTLTSGQIFFNVTKPLKNNETLNIRSQDTITGVRGTSGVVTGKLVAILEGTVEVTIVDGGSDENGNPRSTEQAIAQVKVAAGEMLDIIAAAEAAREAAAAAAAEAEKTGDSAAIAAAEAAAEAAKAASAKLEAENIPAMVVEAIKASPTLAEAVQEALPELNVEALVESLPEKQAQEAQQAAEAEREAQANAQAQATQIQQLNASDGTNGVVADTNAFADAAAAAGVEPAPAATAPATERDDDRDSGSSGGNGGGNGGSGGTPTRTTFTVPLPTTSAALNDYLSRYDVVIIPDHGAAAAGTAGSPVGTINDPITPLTIPGGKTLNVGTGDTSITSLSNSGTLVIPSGAILDLMLPDSTNQSKNAGTITVEGTMNLNANSQSGGMKLTNSGTINNKGTLNVINDAILQNGKTLLNSGTLSASSGGRVENAAGSTYGGSGTIASGSVVTFIATLYANGAGAHFSHDSTTSVTGAIRYGEKLLDEIYALGQEPERDGYEKTYWFKNAAATSAIAETETVTGHIVVYAGWKRVTKSLNVTREPYFSAISVKQGGSVLTAGANGKYTVNAGEDFTVSVTLSSDYMIRPDTVPVALYNNANASFTAGTGGVYTFTTQLAANADAVTTIAPTCDAYYKISTLENLSSQSELKLALISDYTGNSLQIVGQTPDDTVEVLIPTGVKVTLTGNLVLGQGAGAGKLFNYGTVSTVGNSGNAAVTIGSSCRLENYGTIRAVGGRIDDTGTQSVLENHAGGLILSKEAIETGANTVDNDGTIVAASMGGSSGVSTVEGNGTYYLNGTLPSSGIRHYLTEYGTNVTYPFFTTQYVNGSGNACGMWADDGTPINIAQYSGYLSAFKWYFVWDSHENWGGEKTPTSIVNQFAVQATGSDCTTIAKGTTIAANGTSYTVTANTVLFTCYATGTATYVTNYSGTAQSVSITRSATRTVPSGASGTNPGSECNLIGVYNADKTIRYLIVVIDP